MTRLRRLLLPAALAALTASPATAQWVRLQRCAGAIPCSIPFAVRYAPDPLIAAQYGRVSPDVFTGRVSLESKPSVELDLKLSPDFAREAARRFVLAHPPPASVKPPETKPSN